MSSNPLHRLEFSRRVSKRAQYEAFEFAVTDDGVVVRNSSHATPEEHEYLVTIEDGIPAACGCPADENYPGACKHRVAVAIRTPVLEAALDRQVAADGGRPVGQVQADGVTWERTGDAATETTPEDGDEREDEDCTCGELPEEFPCWECVRVGRRDLEAEE